MTTNEDAGGAGVDFSGEGTERRVVVSEDAVPPLEEGQVRTSLVAAALRLDGLVQLLIEKGLITRAEYRRSVERSATTRLERVLAMVVGEEAELPAAE